MRRSPTSRRCARPASSSRPSSERCCWASRSAAAASPPPPWWRPAASSCRSRPDGSEVAELARRVGAGGERRTAGGLAEMAERPAHRGERDVVPGNVGPAEQADLDAFRAGCDLGRQQTGAIDYLHLAQPRDAVDAEHAVDLDPCARFLPGLAQGAFGGGLV